MRGIAFLDRDGTLIEEAGYLSDPSRLREIPGASESLLRLSRAGIALAVVSNQAGLARGKFGEEEFDAVRRAFLDHFGSKGVRFDAVEYCPHHPEGTVERYRAVCGCRKPATGLAERILARLRVPASCTRWTVGDKMTDVVMGKRLGAKTVLVATGYGERERESGEGEGIRPDAFVPGIREAVDWILGGGD